MGWEFPCSVDPLKARTEEGSAGYLGCPWLQCIPGVRGPPCRSPPSLGLRPPSEDHHQLEGCPLGLPPFPSARPLAAWPQSCQILPSAFMGERTPSPSERAPVPNSFCFLQLHLACPDSHSVSISLLMGSLWQPFEADRTAFITDSSCSFTDKRAELTREGHRTARGRAAEDPGLKGRAFQAEQRPPFLPPTDCFHLLLGQ